MLWWKKDKFICSMLSYNGGRGGQNEKGILGTFGNMCVALSTKG